MKNATSPDSQTVPSNIIFFPRQHVRSTGDSGTQGVQTSSSEGMKSDETSIRMIPQFRSQSEHILDLMAETREILTKYSGVGAALAGFREKTLYALPSIPLSNGHSGESTSNHRPMKIPITEAQMAELFAIKRQEKPPENFFIDFIEEFHRRNDPPKSKFRPTPSKQKVSRSS